MILLFLRHLYQIRFSSFEWNYFKETLSVRMYDNVGANGNSLLMYESVNQICCDFLFLSVDYCRLGFSISIQKF